jgi:hypothetical protein
MNSKLSSPATLDPPASECSGNLMKNGPVPLSAANDIIRSVLDAQSRDFQIRAANGRLTPREVRALPDTPLPAPYDRLRTLDETVDLVAQRGRALGPDPARQPGRGA